jgi:hypothetical protein
MISETNTPPQKKFKYRRTPVFTDSEWKVSVTRGLPQPEKIKI